MPVTGAPGPVGEPANAGVPGSTGYAHAAYATSVAGTGRPLRLASADGWLIERRIPGAAACDASGCYPLFVCGNWDAVEEDLLALQDRLVSVTLVTDPFGGYRLDRLRGVFADCCMPFKTHFVTDLERPLDAAISAHHRRNMRRALARVSVEVVADPAVCLDEWNDLYRRLVGRHHITGAADFSRASFERQLRTPGLVMLRGRHAGETVGAFLWYLDGPVAYYHLGACTEAGYRLGASFALMGCSLDALRGRVGLAGLGGAAGYRDARDGLARFKRGWSTGTRTVYLCGRILDAERYRLLAAAPRPRPAWIFPAYRRP